MWKVNLPIQTDGLGIDVLISIPKCPFYPSNHPFPLPHLLFGPNICSFFGILPPSATIQKSFLPPIFMGRLSVWHTPNPQNRNYCCPGEPMDSVNCWQKVDGLCLSLVVVFAPKSAGFAGFAFLPGPTDRITTFCPQFHFLITPFPLPREE